MGSTPTIGDLGRRPHQPPSDEWALGGLLVGTQWVLGDGRTRVVEKATLQSERMHGQKAQWPAISFEYGPQKAVSQFKRDILEGEVTPKDAGADWLAEFLGHPATRSGSDDETPSADGATPVDELAEELEASRAILEAEADELAARDDVDDHLQDVIEGLRHRAEEAEQTLNEHYFESP